MSLIPLEEIIGDEKEEKQQQERRAIKPAMCFHCKGNYYVEEGPATQAYENGKSHGFCSNACRHTWLGNKAMYSDDDLDFNQEAKSIEIKDYDMQGGKAATLAGATEITDNTLEKKLIDATAPYNEKAARNAENFAKASIEVGKSIIDQLNLNPLKFINKTKELGVKVYKITQEGIYLLFPGDVNIGKSVDKLIKSGTKLYFIPMRILGTIAITIFLSMFGVSIDLKFLEKIPGLKPFIDLIIKYTSIITQILKNFNIPGLSIPTLSLKNLLFPNVIDAAYRKGDYEGGSKKKKKKTRRKTRRKTKQKKN